MRLNTFLAPWEVYFRGVSRGACLADHSGGQDSIRQIKLSGGLALRPHLLGESLRTIELSARTSRRPLGSNFEAASPNGEPKPPGSSLRASQQARNTGYGPL